MNTILIAVDGSARAIGVVDAGIAQARATNARAILYRVVVVPPDFSPPGVTEGDPLPAHLEREAHEQLNALSVRLSGFPFELRVEQASQPWRAILATAEAVAADLIVVGSHGNHGWDHILGTTLARS